jgi:hypothetical protein
MRSSVAPHRGHPGFAAEPVLGSSLYRAHPIGSEMRSARCRVNVHVLPVRAWAPCGDLHAGVAARRRRIFLQLGSAAIFQILKVGVRVREVGQAEQMSGLKHSPTLTGGDESTVPVTKDPLIIPKRAAITPTGTHRAENTSPAIASPRPDCRPPGFDKCDDPKDHAQRHTGQKAEHERRDRPAAGGAPRRIPGRARVRVRVRVRRWVWARPRIRWLRQCHGGGNPNRAQESSIGQSHHFTPAARVMPDNRELRSAAR